MGETYDTIDTMRVNVKPCLGCYACWRMTPGKCVQQDDMAGILDRILESELVIWSTPLYCYSVPSNLKVIYDRLIPLGTMEQRVDEEGRNLPSQDDRKFDTQDHTDLRLRLSKSREQLRSDKLSV